MEIRITLAALAAAICVASSATGADAKRAKHHHPGKTAPLQPNAGTNLQGQARMIEVKPGMWISSYGCVTDDGYGRFLPCDVTDGSGGR